MPRRDTVKDDSGSYAMFTEQLSSASQMMAAKVMDSQRDGMHMTGGGGGEDVVRGRQFSLFPSQQPDVNGGSKGLRLGNRGDW